MSPPRTDQDYLEDISTESSNLAEFVKGYSFERFAKDTKTIHACVRSLEIIGEAAKCVSAPTRAKYPQLPWKQMAAMRDLLIHNYSGVDSSVVWSTIRDSIPPLRRDLDLILGKK